MAVVVVVVEVRSLEVSSPAMITCRGELSAYRYLVHMSRVEYTESATEVLGLWRSADMQALAAGICARGRWN